MEPPLLIDLPFDPETGDPRRPLLELDLPHGEPWGWAFAQGILSSAALALRLYHGLPAGLAALLRKDLEDLRSLLGKLKHEYPLADLGGRTATEAEWSALRLLESGTSEDLPALYRSFGVFPFVQYSAFFWDGKLIPVAHPDPVDFSELVGYHEAIRALKRNTERFLDDMPSLSVLLYGARGTGKSTAVKALRTTYESKGLKLVEVLREGQNDLSGLLELLRPLPYHFVLYLDDLAYSEAETSYHRLKALLEGAVYESPTNVLVIATSNRRNLVQESWADRPEPGLGEPAAWDTLQEKLALADRFGLTLTFPAFDQAMYLEAVEHHLGHLDETTRTQALRFARDGRGFSGRSARQFVNQL